MTLLEMPERTAPLCVVVISRRGDGTIKAELQDVPVTVIEHTGHDVQSRVEQIAAWVKEAASDLERQAAGYSLDAARAALTPKETKE